MSGTLSPDATGNFYTAGLYNGRGYARRADGAYFLWWDGVDTWTISAVLGTPGADYWEEVAVSPVSAAYDPLGTATGVAAVAEGAT